MGHNRRLHNLRHRLARLLLPAVTQSPSNRDVYYLQQPTCQIPDLWHLLSFFLGERTGGLFVEVGAYDGVFASNSWGVAQRGWRGLMIEPIPNLAQACRRNHAERRNIEVIETAIGGPALSSVSLELAGTLTTANVDVVAEYGVVEWAKGSLTGAQMTVSCVTLDEVLDARSVESDFDLLIVDVEGFESDVFAGFEVERWRPKMMIVELLDTHPDLSATALADSRLGAEIQGFGYRIAFKDSINTVFVREDVWNASLERGGR